MKRLAFAFLCCFSLCLSAQGNIKAGQEKSMVCAACHGMKGISSNPEWPNLAGQHATYLLKQLKDFKQAKTRANPSMNAILLSLSPKDMADLSAYYASLPAAEGSTPKDKLARGQQIYRGGDFKKHITACIACHGPRGLGNAQAGFPRLSGQHAKYTEIQLKAFKKGKRQNDLNSIMRDIASHLNHEDRAAVALYVQGLH